MSTFIIRRCGSFRNVSKWSYLQPDFDCIYEDDGDGDGKYDHKKNKIVWGFTEFHGHSMNIRTFDNRLDAEKFIIDNKLENCEVAEM